MALKLGKKSLMAAALATALTLNLTAVNVLATDKRSKVVDFSNVLNVTANPTDLLYGSYSTNKYNNFSDQGAWHGYYLPSKDATNIYGGFAGPVIIAEEYPVNLGDTISKITVSNVENGQAYDLAQAEVSFDYYPGKLVQTYDLEDFKLTLELIFASNRTALITTKIDNKTNKDLNLNLEWTGNIFNQFKEKEDGKVYELGQSLQATENGVQVNFSEMRETWRYFSTEETKFVVNYEGDVETTVEGNSYTTRLTTPVTIKSNESFTTDSTQTYTFTTEELNNEQSKIQDMLSNSDKYFVENNTRWQGYLDKTFANA